VITQGQTLENPVTGERFTFRAPTVGAWDATVLSRSDA